MAEVPTREEIYAQVDERFRASVPDAPAKLSGTKPEHEWYRQQWLEIRDQAVNDWTDSLYWARYPDGPEKIDPENPDHNRYVNGWIEIRDAIMSNSPLPPVDDEDLVVDMSPARWGIQQSLHEILAEVPSELHNDVRAFGDEAVDLIYEAYHLSVVGRSRDSAWSSDWHDLPRRPNEALWRLRVVAWWDENGSAIHGELFHQWVDPSEVEYL